ncbi:hypothetical protein ACFQ5M_04725 [Agrilactobacillus yilanensis]|uniref:WxL domain-containing protein n=1 Tax=Agrilactobacillus yilanensis TaxID=2485997 RepID=A0ABW4J6V6_9LACO|nr:hypothetical protein [Agrilactobacillus yilanensis]
MKHSKKVSILLMTSLLFSSVITTVPEVTAAQVAAPQIPATPAAALGQNEGGAASDVEIDTVPNLTPDSAPDPVHPEDTQTLPSMPETDGNTESTPQTPEAPTDNNVLQPPIIESETVADENSEAGEVEETEAAEKNEDAATKRQTEIPVNVTPPKDATKPSHNGGSLLGGVGGLLDSILLSALVYPGFTKQPEKNQYVAYGAPVYFKMRSIGNAGPVQDPWLKITQWTLQKDGSFVKKEHPDVVKGDGILGKHKYDVTFGKDGKQNLEPGVHFFQFALDGYAGNTVYSKLARVNVVKDEVPAEQLSIKSEDVLWSGLDYELKGLLTPLESTSEVRWHTPINPTDQEDEKNPVIFSSNVGRDVEIAISDGVMKAGKSTAKVNEDTENPGIPIVLNAQAGDLKATKTVYAGGLKAKTTTVSEATTKGITWHEVAGLERVRQVYFGSEGEDFKVQKVNAEWVYQKVSKNKRISFNGGKSFGSDTNAKQNDLADLRDIKPLVIPGTNKIIQDFAGKTGTQQMAVQLKIGIVIKIKDGKSTTINLASNYASLKLIPDSEGDEGNQELTFRSAPSFTFNGVKASQIYDGVSQLPTTSGTEAALDIANSTTKPKRWQLQAQLGAFKDSDNQELNQPQLHLHGLPTATATLTTSDPTPIITSEQYKNDNTLISATLDTAPNQEIILKKDQHFVSDIRWILSEEGPESEAL